MGFKGRNGREKTKGEINRDMWNLLNGVYQKGGNTAGHLTLQNKTGIHIEDEELRKQWALLGGNASIDKLLKWQEENNFRVCDLERTDEWCDNISIALKKYYEENPIPIELRIQIGNKIKENNSKLSKKERSEKYSNDSASKKSLRIRTEVLKLIKKDTFTTSDARKVCEKYGLGNWKGFLKDKRIIKQIYKGTTGTNPSIYQKIK